MNYKEIENNMTLTPDTLKGVNILDTNIKAVDFSAYTFWQYTNVDSICKILGGSCFWVNNISGMNDMREADLVQKKRTSLFSASATATRRRYRCGISMAASSEEEPASVSRPVLC